MKQYLIDGNNLIGKIKPLSRMQKNYKQGAREKLVLMLERYFHTKKALVSVHFDGFRGETISTSLLKIYYSGERTADDKIKKQIDAHSNPRNILLVTSDNNLAEYGRVCSCTVIKSEDFSKLLTSQPEEDEEAQKTGELNNIEEFKKLFGAK